MIKRVLRSVDSLQDKCSYHGSGSLALDELLREAVLQMRVRLLKREPERGVSRGSLDVWGGLAREEEVQHGLVVVGDAKVQGSAVKIMGMHLARVHKMHIPGN